MVKDIWQTPAERLERRKFLSEQREMERIYGTWNSAGPKKRKKKNKKISENP